LSAEKAEEKAGKLKSQGLQVRVLDQPTRHKGFNYKKTANSARTQQKIFLSNKTEIRLRKNTLKMPGFPRAARKNNCFFSLKK